MCAICLEDIKDNNESCMITGCDHTFHKNCITDLLIHSNKDNYKCPLCRTPFSKVIDLSNEKEVSQYYQDKSKGIYHQTQNTFENEAETEIIYNPDWESYEDDDNIYIRYFNNDIYEEDLNLYTSSNFENEQLEATTQNIQNIQDHHYYDEQDIEFENIFQLLISEEEHDRNNLEMQYFEFI
jgi:hypothetical protein